MSINLSKVSKTAVEGWWMLAMTMVCKYYWHPSSFATQCQARLTSVALATFRRYEITSKLAVESKPLVGSSRNKILGDVINWLAMLNRRF